VKLVASQEGLLLDPVYTGKAMAGCWMASVANASMKARSSSCTPVGRRRCLPIRTFCNREERLQPQAVIFFTTRQYSFRE
jgi:hypothetical protein